MQEATGKYILFLDCDDFYEPEMVEKAFRRAEEEQAEIVIYKSDQYNMDTEEYVYEKWAMIEWALPPYEPFNRRQISTNIFRAFVGWAWDKLYLREFVMKNDLKFQEQRTTNDALFVFSALVLAERICTVSEILIHRRVDTRDSLSKTREKSWDNFYHMLLALRQMLKDHGLYTEIEKDYINYALHFSLWNYNTLAEPTKTKLREKLLGEKVETAEAVQVPARPPILCPGCPHRSVFSVLSELKIHAAGDIGCYTLGAVAPLSVIDTTVCMGSSISTLHGREKAKGKDYIKNWVAVIGDSTFLHTGVNSLMNMVYNQSTGTVIILDNSTTGMTGHQDHAATGKTLMGDPTYAIDIYNLCKALGIQNVHEINAFDIEGLKKLIKEETAKDEVSVIITKSPCVLLKTTKITGRCKAIPEKCKKCGMCLKPGCPAVIRQEDGTIRIDDTLCTGCGLCMKRCKFDAIEREEF